MRYILKLIKILFLGLIWTILYAEGIRSIMLQNWRFDIIKPEHWQFAWRLWLDGWVIDEPKEWAFVVILLTIIPLWLTGWTALSLVPWGNLMLKLIKLPINIFKKIFKRPPKIKYKKAKVQKKKSYKQTRPPSIRGNIVKSSKKEEKSASTPVRNSLPTQHTKDETPSATKAMKSLEIKKIDDNFDFDFDDDDDDFDFNFDDEIKVDDIDDEPKKSNQSNKNKKDNNKDNRNNKKQNNNERKSQNNKKDNNQNKSKKSDVKDSSSVSKSFNSKGYHVIYNADINGDKIDYVAISNNEIYLCKVDAEKGDWLADEEKFNNEAPLWFSESSHRISPVRKVLDAKEKLDKSLKTGNSKLNIIPMIVVTKGNIINAEDMLDIWDDLDVLVCRADQGTPEELKTLSEIVKPTEAAESSIINKVKKTLSSL